MGTAKNKNKESERTIPLPPVVVDLLKDFDFVWGSAAHINKQIQTMNPDLSSHSFRHGLAKLVRASSQTRLLPKQCWVTLEPLRHGQQVRRQVRSRGNEEGSSPLSSHPDRLTDSLVMSLDGVIP